VAVRSKAIPGQHIAAAWGTIGVSDYCLKIMVAEWKIDKKKLVALFAQR